MEFISAEEFLKQDKKIQEVFLKWWKCEEGDLYKWISNSTFEDVQVLNKSAIETFKYDEFISFKKDCTPLLTEGQLRKFIEDKTKFPILKIELINGRYDIYTQYKAIDNYSDICVYDELGENLLQAYWKVAIQIAKEL